VLSLCPDPHARIIAPAPNAEVSGRIPPRGTATHDAFRYYKLEYAGGADAETQFIYLGGGNAPIINGMLAEFDTTTLPNGDYTLRLTVVDVSGNYPPPCQVTIKIRN